MKKSVKVTVDGVEKIFYVKKPSSKEESLAKLEANKKFREALDSGAYLREELNKKLMERGVWSKEEQDKLTELSSNITKNLEKIDEGGIELEEAKKLAVQVKFDRLEFLRMSQKLREHDTMTVEGQSDNTYFDALVSLCCFDDQGNKLFKSYDDYLEKSTEEYSIECAKELGKMHFGLNDDWQKELPENKFLLEYKFINDDLDFVREDGKLIDSEGKLVDKNGRYVDENGNFVNYAGERVDENGKVMKERKPFLRNGQPV